VVVQDAVAIAADEAMTVLAAAAVVAALDVATMAEP